MHRQVRGLIQAAVLIAATSHMSAVAIADVLRIGGTGAAAAAFKQIGEKFSAATGDKVEIVPNLGTTGGLRAVQDGVLDLCVSGRPLKPEETAKGLTSRLTVRTPYILVTSHKRPNGLKRAEVSDVYSNEKATWADKEPVRVILRPKSDSDTPIMGELFPGMSAAIETARKRAEVFTAATDHDNIDAAQRIPGSLTGMTFLQFAAEKPSLRLVSLDGVEPSLQAFEAGAYKPEKSLQVVSRTAIGPPAGRFLAFLRSPEGERLLREAGAYLTAN